MDNWFEILIPIVVILLYLFSRGRGGDEVEGPAPGQSETSEEARRIQEEIRRKIVARQQGRELEPASSTLQEESGSGTGLMEPERDSARAETGSQRAGGFHDTSAPSRFERYREETPRTIPVPASTAPARDYQEELRAQLQRVKESKEAHRRAFRIAGDKNAALGAAKGGADRSRRSGGEFSRDGLLDELQNRGGLQKAFVLKEILGRPVATRPVRDSFAEFSSY